MGPVGSAPLGPVAPPSRASFPSHRLPYGINLQSLAPFPKGKDAEALRHGFKTFTNGQGCISTAFFEPVTNDDGADEGCKVTLHVELPVHPFWFHDQKDHGFVHMERAIKGMGSPGSVRYLPELAFPPLLVCGCQDQSPILNDFDTNEAITRRIVVERTFYRVWHGFQKIHT